MRTAQSITHYDREQQAQEDHMRARIRSMVQEQIRVQTRQASSSTAMATDPQSASDNNAQPMSPSEAERVAMVAEIQARVE